MASRSRRAQFEEQLRALQDDIAGLSRRLAVPSSGSVSFTHPPSSASRDRASRSADESRMHGEDLRHGEEGGSKGAASRFKRELHMLTRERDDAVFRLRQAEREVETMSKTILELNRWKAQHDRLLQDNEALKVSLESSERIRKQQKELVVLLQRSNAVADNSVLSFGNSVSTIPRDADARSSGEFSAAPSADEHRSWLNGFSALSPHRPPLPTRREAVSFQDSQQPESERRTTAVVRRSKPREFSPLTGRRVDAPRRPVVALAPRSMTAPPRPAPLVAQRRGGTADDLGRPPKYPAAKASARPASAPASSSRTSRKSGSAR